MKAGDAVASIAKPIARTLDSVLGTKIANCPKCGQAQTELNNAETISDFYDAVKHRFQQRRQMQIQISRVVSVTGGGKEFIVNIGVSVEADSIDEAIEKTRPSEGVLMSLTANANPNASGISADLIKEAISKVTPSHGIVIHSGATPR